MSNIARPAHDSSDEERLVRRCADESLRLLAANLTPRGILAARRSPEAEARAYTRIFGRDAGVCALAMAGSGVAELEEGAVASLDSLAKLQAPNGQIPKYVDPEGSDADFWYLGCIDATLWWLIAVDHVRRSSSNDGMRTRWQPAVERAVQWLLAQEHQRFFLLQQNEASDWADIMPRSGFVLYTNALWYRVKQRFGLPNLDETRHHFNHLFHPFSRDLPEYRRSRLLRHYAVRGQRDPGLYLSFVNLSFAGDEGDVFGNLLAILCGLAGDARANEIVKTLLRCGRGRSLSDPRRHAADHEGARTVARLHGAPPAEPAAPVPQWRHLAVRRRVLGTGVGDARQQGACPCRTRQAGARQQPRRLALHRVVPRQDTRAEGNGRSELERRRVSCSQDRCSMARVLRSEAAAKSCSTALPGRERRRIDRQGQPVIRA